MKEITIGLTEKQKTYLATYAEIFNDFTYVKENELVTFFCDMNTIKQICDYTGADEDDALVVQRVGTEAQITFGSSKEILDFIQEIKGVI